MAESVMMKLARHVGHEEAHEIIYECSGKAAKNDLELAAVLKGDSRVLAHMSETEIDSALDPSAYLGDAMRIVDAAVTSAERVLR
jgi:3-carboxy-cis,cis-muconate cycloisomerase